jgi:glycine/D-amino acid oxidase-like deaminating enzyme
MASEMNCDFAVVGAGIAGLAISELLQRSGASVVLIEKNKTLCSEASSEQQGWFHTGALYTALPDQFSFRAMVGNLDDLIDYYRAFPNMNLRVDKHVSSASSEGWFSNRTNFYAYTSCKGVSWKWKIPWMLALHRAKRRMSWFENLDASRSLSRQMGKASKPLKFVLHTPSLGVKLNDVAFVLKSRDRAMNTRLIIEDLLRSFIAHGGLIKTETKVRTIDRGSVIADAASGESPARICARHIIVTAGKESTSFSPNIRVVMSPLLVVSPALVDVNFIKMSPDMKDTINHIYHRFNGLNYSLIGNAVYHDPDECTGDRRETLRQHMVNVARKVFGEFDDNRAEIYFGSKTEVTSSSFLRNYLYHIVDRGTYTLALPGKFSLCFSLAANVCRHFGIEPVEQIKTLSKEDISHLVDDPLHHRLAKQISLQ